MKTFISRTAVICLMILSSSIFAKESASAPNLSQYLANLPSIQDMSYVIKNSIDISGNIISGNYGHNNESLVLAVNVKNNLMHSINARKALSKSFQKQLKISRFFPKKKRELEDAFQQQIMSLFIAEYESCKDFHAKYKHLKVYSEANLNKEFA